MSFDPATVAAFVDGELDDVTARRIAREAESDAALATEIARHRALKAQLAAHFAPIVAEAVPERLRALIVDPKVDASLAERRAVKRARFAPTHWGAIAAALVLGLTIGLKPWTTTADVTSANGTLIASVAEPTIAGPSLARWADRLAAIIARPRRACWRPMRRR